MSTITAQLQQLLSHQRRWLTSEQAAFFESQDALDAASLADSDAEALARIVLVELDGCSLDPLFCSSLEGCMRNWGDSISFQLRFHRLSALAPVLTLPVGSSLIERVADAMRRNFDSRLFKAARLDRRLQAAFLRSQGKTNREQFLAYQRKLEAMGYNSPFAAIPQSAVLEAESFGVEHVAKRRADLDRRHRLLIDSAMPGVAGRSWSEWSTLVLDKALRDIVSASA